jgi:hypothetical protein
MPRRPSKPGIWQLRGTLGIEAVRTDSGLCSAFSALVLFGISNSQRQSLAAQLCHVCPTGAAQRPKLPEGFTPTGSFDGRLR